MALVYSALAAGHSQRRIAVLTPDDELLRAISLSLSPWGVETIRSDVPAPEPSQPEAVHATSRLARSLGVDAVVWVSSIEGGSLLWVFDARAGEVTTRILDQLTPFDSAAAAAVALSVKTVLRSSELAPLKERFGAHPEERAVAEPQAPAVASPVERASARSEPPFRSRRSAFEVGAGGQWLSPRQVEPRFEVTGGIWFAAARRFGGSLELSYGPGLSIDDTRYRGTYREFVAGAKGRYRIVHLPALWAAVSLGGAARWTHLSGTLVESSSRRSLSRFNLSLDAEVLMSFVISGGAYIGASAGTSYLPAYERYLVGGQPVFSRRPFTSSLGGYCGVELF